MPQLATIRQSFDRFPAWHPLTKLGAWLAIVLGLAATIQAAAWLLGIDFNILSHGNGGRGVLLVLALGVLLVLMALERRPAADFGLVAGSDWTFALGGGFAVGVVSYAGYCLLATAAGAFEFHPERGTAYRWVSSLGEGLAGFPLAAAQQLIFSGYLLTLFRGRYPRPVSAALVGVLFAGLHYVDRPWAALSAAEAPLALGLGLIAALLAYQRMAHGGVLVPIGLLSGWLLVRRVMKKTALVSLGDPSAALWWCPDADPRRAPLMWLALACGLVGYMVWVRLRGERQHTDPLAITASFKQVAPLSNVSMLAPLDLWIGRLWQARLAVGWKYLPRLAAILAFSSVNTLLSLPERLLAPLLLRRKQVADPLFVLGVHRSGTTHLHNLLALDPQLVAPLAYQIMNPHGFLSTGWLWVPLFGAFSPWQRPMDSVRFHIFSPNEEEFALSGMTRLSPYWALTFPRQVAYYDRYIHPADFSPRELAAWQRCYQTFVRKLTAWTRRRPVLKNPHNTARVSALRQMYPGAKFIHLHRDPTAVYRSNLHMAREGHCVHQLQDPDADDNYSTRFLANYRAMEEAYYEQTRDLPPNQVVEVRYEDLDRDPLGTLARIYGQLELDLSPEFRRRLERYLGSVADYQKNRFRPMPEEQARLLNAEVGSLFDRWGYPRPSATPPAAAA